jgi:DNA helicase II / ATP-dependent DNA helicase PcrA
VNDGTLPDFRANTEPKLKEEKNIAYVAVTRAKRWIYLTYPNQKTMPWGEKHIQYKSKFLK